MISTSGKCSLRSSSHVIYGFTKLCALSFERVLSIHRFAALDLGAGIEQPFGCLIVQNRHAVQSMRRSTGGTFEDNVVDGLFFCATLTGRRGGHILFVQAGAETSDTGAEAVKLDPCCSWKGHSGRVGADVGVNSTEFRKVVQPLRIPLVIHEVRRTYVVIR